MTKSEKSAIQSGEFPQMPVVGSAWAENIAEYGQEVLQFVARRVSEDVQTQHELMHAKGVEEVQHIQAQFFQRAMDDYAAETARLMELGRSIAPAFVALTDD